MEPSTVSTVKQHAQNALIGLAIGDAISWSAMFHRSFLLPQWTRRIRREIDSASENENVIILPTPFSLNQSSKHFNISPTCGTEWAAFTANILLSNNCDFYEQAVFNMWKELAKTADTIRGGVSTRAALKNLCNGLNPPQSGKENPHYFDDFAMPRAVPIGIICAGKPEQAAKLAEIDASITNSEDGIWAAQAIAVMISLLCSGKSINYAIDAAYQHLPQASWIRRIVDEALLIAQDCESIFSVLPKLQNEIVNHEYSYGNVAPETLALAIVIIRLHGNNFESALTVSLSFSKSSETLPAMIGALAGANQSKLIASENWLNAVSLLKGVCIPSLAGQNYLSLIEQLLTKID